MTQKLRAPNTDNIFMTVWDGGGSDTYDFGDFTGGLTIDLRAGHWIASDDDFEHCGPGCD